MKMVAVTAAALTIVMSPALVSLPVGGNAAVSLSLVSPARAEDAWKAEFEEVCGKTEDSMGMTKDELKALMARCDKLKPTIDAQEETVRKVYLRRLQMCRDLFAYVYEVKNKN